MVKGYERETIRSSPKMGDMSFEEWQDMKDDQIQRELRVWREENGR